MNLAAVAALLIALAAVYVALHRGFAVPWYLNTEEFPYAQEVIRFADGNFRQEFWDIPGTPLMLAAAAIFRVYHLIVSLAGGDASASGITLFAFENLQAIYLILRSLNAAAFLGAVLFTFLLGQRIGGGFGGLVAAMLIAWHFDFAFTVTHIRIEPLAVMLVAACAWLALRAEGAARAAPHALAGAIGGLAMAARFPTGLAIGLFLLAWHLLRPTVLYGRTVHRAHFAIIGAMAIVAVTGATLAVLLGAGIVTRNALSDAFWLSIDHGGYPQARRAFALLWIAAGSTALAFLAALAVAMWRRPDLARSATGLALWSAGAGGLLGFLAGTPTILWSPNYFMRSIDMFIARNAFAQENLHSLPALLAYFLFGEDAIVTWRDAAALRLGPSETVTAIFSIPQVGLIASLGAAATFAVGAVAALLRRERAVLAALVAIAIGIAAQYGKIQGTRHMVSWLPFVAAVCALGAACLAGILAVPWRRAAQVVLLAAAAIQPVVLLETVVASNAAGGRQRQELLVRLTEWLERNTIPADRVFHTCCDPVDRNAIFRWMEFNGIVLPAALNRNPNRTIWFGDIQSLQAAGRGLIVVSRLGYASQYVAYYRQVDPSRLTDPYHDPRFTLRVSFEAPRATWDVFAFDLTR